MRRHKRRSSAFCLLFMLSGRRITPTAVTHSREGMPAHAVYTCTDTHLTPSLSAAWSTIVYFEVYWFITLGLTAVGVSNSIRNSCCISPVALFMHPYQDYGYCCCRWRRCFHCCCCCCSTGHLPPPYCCCNAAQPPRSSARRLDSLSVRASPM